MLPMATLMLAVVAAFGVRACIARIRSRSAAAIVTGLLVGTVAFESLIRSTPHLPAGQLVPAIYRRIADTSGKFARMTEPQCGAAACLDQRFSIFNRGLHTGSIYTDSPELQSGSARALDVISELQAI